MANLLRSIPSYVNLVAADIVIGRMKTKMSKPISTAKATSIKVGIPHGIKAAKVPPKIIAAETTTVPMMAHAFKILALGVV